MIKTPDATPATSVVPAAQDPAAISIIEATDVFLLNRAQRGIESSTMSKYKTFVKQLRAYCDLCGYLRINQLTITDMDRFYASWNDAKRSRAKKLERLKGFICFPLKLNGSLKTSLKTWKRRKALRYRLTKLLSAMTN